MGEALYSRAYYIWTVMAGVAYGLILRGGAQLQLNWHIPPVVSFGFILCVPFGMGFISVFLAERRARQSVGAWFYLPVVTVSLALLGTMAAVWEGFICVAMFAPIAWLCGILGGIIAGLNARYVRRSAANVSLMIVVVLPFLVTSPAQKLFYDYQVRSVSSVIDIHAPADVVWRNIERVPSIQAPELPPAWSRRIGFPAPDEATLSHEGVGGVRHATFKGGVLFIETVDTWEPDHRLGFSIRAETEFIPKTTLDEHVRIGGPYFDVLHGEYVLEPLGTGATRLHLTSRHRVSTDVNWYAHLWTDAVMRDIQRSILFVIKNRCEQRH